MRSESKQVFGRALSGMIALAFLLLGSQAALAISPLAGAAKTASIAGREVTFDLYLEAFSDAAGMTLTDDLDATFGAGNYAMSAAPVKTSGPATVVPNAGFDGSTVKDLLLASSLLSGETASLRFVVEVTTPSDQGHGLGVYENQAIVAAGGLTDLSDEGIDPDPNGDGDPTGLDEDDPTRIDFSADPTLGVAKAAATTGTQVTLDFVLENLGNVELGSVQLADDLDGVFGTGNFSLLSGPTLIVDPGTLTVNTGFDGSSETALLAGGTLGVGVSATLRVVVDVTTLVDQGAGLGVYSNQVAGSALGPNASTTSDLSDAGGDPDANGNGNPGDPGEDDPTIFAIGEQPVIGAAKTATVSGPDVTLDLFLENLGNTPLNDVTLEDRLDDVFGAGTWLLTSGPTWIVDPGTLVINASYDGSSDSDLLDAGSTLAIGASAQLRIVARSTKLSDRGLGLGNYSNQARATGRSPSLAWTEDLSDAGSDPDPDGDGDPSETGEDDPTLFSVAESPVIGVAKQVLVLPAIAATVDIGGVLTAAFGPRIVVTLFLENLGNVALSTVTLTDDLDAVFGAGNYGTVASGLFPEVVSTDGGLVRNSGYNGSTDTALLLAGSTLGAGEMATVVFEALVVTVTDQGSGLGAYSNQATAGGDGPGGGMTSDLSDSGSVVDANGNGDPSDGGEDDPTLFVVGSALGAAKTATVVGNEVTFDLYLESFGASTIGSLSLAENLDSVFGAGNYTLTTPPTLLDDPGTLTLNPGFDGSGDTELFAPGGSLVGGDTAMVQLAVTVDTLIPGGNGSLGLGTYANQTVVSGLQPGDVLVIDGSNSGTDPDPNGNGDPAEPGENDPTVFSITANAVVGAAKDAAISGNTVTIDLYLEAFGAQASTNITLTDDLDQTFGAGNYSLAAPPSLIDDPGTLVLNGAFDGGGSSGGDISLLGAGSTLAAGATAQIRFVVDVTTVTDQGAGMGVFFNQAEVAAEDASGVLVVDLSTDGIDPDPNGNGDPTEPGLADPPVPGENQPTPILIGTSSLGAALQTYVSGTLITVDILLENLGDLEITSVGLVHTLFTTLGFGNYAIAQPPVVMEGPAGFAVISSFDGTFVSTLINGQRLGPFEQARVRYVIDVTNVTDQGNGLGVYPLQVSPTGLDPGGSPVGDDSDDGVRSDPNGNGVASDTGENDPSVATIGEEAILGVAKTASVNDAQVTFDLYLENLGNVALSGMSLLDDLDAVLGAGNYSISTSPALVIDPGTLVLAAGYDGSGITDLLAAGSTLAAGSAAQIRFVVDLTTITDRGLGLGRFGNRALGLGIGPSGEAAEDYSDDGSDPDPDGDGNPASAGESDPTLFTVVRPVGGVAKTASSVERIVTLDFFVRNLGSDDLVDMSLVDDLDAVFGNGNYTLLGPPTLMTAERSLFPNLSFDGSSDKELLAPSSSQAAGALEAEQIRLVLQVDTLLDMGAGVGVYQNQASLNAQGANGGATSDLSDHGVLPDPSGNGLPDDPGEDDPTVFTVDDTPRIGAAKTVTVSGRTVTVDLFIENLGAADLTDVSLTDALGPVFGAGNFTVTSAPSVMVGPGTLVANGAFDGGGSSDVLLPASTLASGTSAQIRFVVDVTTVTDQGLGFGVYANQATSSGLDVADSDVASDLSDAGSDPDPNGNGQAGDAGEDDPTPIALEGAIGDLVWEDLDGDGTQGGGELGLPGVVVYLDLNGNAILDGGEPSDTTDAAGAYFFDGLAASAYSVQVDPASVPSGLVSSTANVPTALTLLPGEVADAVDFGYRAHADLSLTKIDSVDPVAAGTSLTYTLTVTNAGPANAESVVVTDTLAAGTTLVATSGCGEDPAAVPTCSLGALAAGSNVSFTVEVMVAAGATGSLLNQASVTSSIFDPDTADNDADESTTVAAEADLSIALSDSADPVAPGATLVYTVDVSNTGPSDAPNVTVTETLPVGVTLVATSGCVEDPSAIPTCSLGSLLAGAATSYSVEVTVDAATPSGTIINSVTVATDAADMNSANDTAEEPTEIDGVPPRVSRVDSLSSTADGELTECEDVGRSVTGLVVVFDEEVQDPPGNGDSDGGADDVTNPANWLLVAAGPDRDLQTASCGAVSGDDVVVPIDGIVYTSVDSTATLSLSSGMALEDALYRLFACGGTTIRDLAGNALDGDGDGTGGDDFLRTFRIARANLLRGGQFDCSLEPWTLSSTLPDEISHAPDDIDDALASGSAEIVNLSGSDHFAIGQCLGLVAGLDCSFSAHASIVAAAGVLVAASPSCTYFDSPACGGLEIGMDTTVELLGDTAGVFSLVGMTATPPTGARSAICALQLNPVASAAFDAFLDDVTLICTGDLLFADGFEGGDTSAWSSTAP